MAGSRFQGWQTETRGETAAPTDFSSIANDYEGVVADHKIVVYVEDRLYNV